MTLLFSQEVEIFCIGNRQFWKYLVEEKPAFEKFSAEEEVVLKYIVLATGRVGKK